MPWRMRWLALLVLLWAAVLALARLVRYALDEPRLARANVRLTVVVVGALLAVFTANRFATWVNDHPWVRAAHDVPLPDGTLPRFHSAEAKTPDTPARELSAAIDQRYPGRGHPVVLSDRTDLFAFYPYYGFVQWNFAYSHPTAEFGRRIEFLRSLSTVAAPAEFAKRTADNPYDRIDAFVLRVEDTAYTFHFNDLNYPYGAMDKTIAFAKSTLDPVAFDIVRLGDYVVAVRRTR
jgi:hypothetical protein